MSSSEINETHDATARSWLDSANGASDFPLQNLPLAIFRHGDGEDWRAGVAIGDRILDLRRLLALDLLHDDALLAGRACQAAVLDDYLAMGPAAWRALRHALFHALSLRAESTLRERVASALLPAAGAQFKVASSLRNYTDFYTSIHHARNVGRLVRPDHPLTPNFEWLPIAYHGRASSVRVGEAGFAFRRPTGQAATKGGPPSVGPCARLDFELELGCFIGQGNELGTPIPLAQAEAQMAGLVLLNDWSARDHQFWEAAPLGPFSGKNFCTTVSPWLVSIEALAPFRQALPRPTSAPAPLPYLLAVGNMEQGAIDVRLEVAIDTPAHRAGQHAPSVITRTSFAHQYWTIAQMITQHTVGGCNLLPGDLLGTGTISGPKREEAGAIIELSEGGTRPVTLAATGEQRRFLEDGDTVILRGWCEREGFARIGFGACVGTILPASPR